VLAVGRLFTEGDSKNTVFRQDVLAETLTVFRDELESDVYIGGQKGLLDEERAKLEAFLG
jgi:hypothetical protein